MCGGVSVLLEYPNCQQTPTQRAQAAWAGLQCTPRPCHSLILPTTVVVAVDYPYTLLELGRAMQPPWALKSA